MYLLLRQGLSVDKIAPFNYGSYTGIVRERYRPTSEYKLGKRNDSLTVSCAPCRELF